MDHLSSLEVSILDCKSLVANEFLDVLCCYDLPLDGLSKLKFTMFMHQCDSFEDEVVSRLASICPRLSHLELSDMNYLSEKGRVSMANLLRQITHNNPPI